MFLDQRIDHLNQAEVLGHLYGMNRAEAYTYLVTPNIQHMLRLLEGRDPETQACYRGADLVICDSRVVELLASMVGKRITAYPGADVVADFLASHPARNYLVGVVGPTAGQFHALAERYPAWRFVHYPTPMMTTHSPTFDQAVGDVLAGEWDFLLICLGFPKQEVFAAALRRRGRTRGTALCVGASVDFLVGAQKRAPVFLRRVRLEWLYRLAQDPKRMWRRYLVECPRLLYWFVRIEVMGRTRLRGSATRRTSG